MLFAVLQTAVFVYLIVISIRLSRIGRLLMTKGIPGSSPDHAPLRQMGGSDPDPSPSAAAGNGAVAGTSDPGSSADRPAGVLAAQGAGTPRIPSVAGDPLAGPTFRLISEAFASLAGRTDRLEERLRAAEEQAAASRDRIQEVVSYARALEEADLRTAETCRGLSDRLDLDRTRQDETFAQQGEVLEALGDRIGELRKDGELTADLVTELDGKFMDLLATCQEIQSQMGEITGDEQHNHDFFLLTAGEISRFESNLSRMDPGTRGYKQLLRGVSRLKENFLTAGYEYVDLLNKPFSQGMKLTASFVTDDSLPPGTQIITGVQRPQINFQGVMLQPAIVTVSQNLAAAVSVQEEQEHEQNSGQEQEHEQNSGQKHEHEQNSLPEQELGSWHEHLHEQEHEHEHEQDHDFDHDHESAATPADLNSSQVSEPVSSQPDPYSGITPTGVSGSSTESVQPGFEEPSVGAAEADSGRGETPSDEPVDEPKTLSSGTDQSDKPFSFAQEPSVPVSTPEDTSRSESSPVAAEAPLKFFAIGRDGLDAEADFLLAAPYRSDPGVHSVSDPGGDQVAEAVTGSSSDSAEDGDQKLATEVPDPATSGDPSSASDPASTVMSGEGSAAENAVRETVACVQEETSGDTPVSAFSGSAGQFRTEVSEPGNEGLSSQVPGSLESGYLISPEETGRGWFAPAMEKDLVPEGRLTPSSGADDPADSVADFAELNASYDGAELGAENGSAPAGGAVEPLFRAESDPAVTGGATGSESEESTSNDEGLTTPETDDVSEPANGESELGRGSDLDEKLAESGSENVPELADGESEQDPDTYPDFDPESKTEVADASELADGAPESESSSASDSDDGQAELKTEAEAADPSVRSDAAADSDPASSPDSDDGQAELKAEAEAEPADPAVPSDVTAEHEIAPDSADDLQEPEVKTEAEDASELSAVTSEPDHYRDPVCDAVQAELEDDDASESADSVSGGEAGIAVDGEMATPGSGSTDSQIEGLSLWQPEQELHPAGWLFLRRAVLGAGSLPLQAGAAAAPQGRPGQDLSGGSADLPGGGAVPPEDGSREPEAIQEPGRAVSSFRPVTPPGSGNGFKDRFNDRSRRHGKKRRRARR